MPHRLTVLVAIGMVWSWASPSAADPIRVEFGGYLVPTYENPAPVGPTRFTGILTYDPATATPSPEYPESPGHALLAGSALHFSLDGSPVSLDVSGLQFNWQAMAHLPEGPPGPGYDLVFSRRGAVGQMSAMLFLTNDPPAEYPPPGLPSATDFTAYPRGSIGFFEQRDPTDGSPTHIYYAGQIDTVRVVPEPSPVLLALVAVGACAAQRRRRH